LLCPCLKQNKGKNLDHEVKNPRFKIYSFVWNWKTCCLFCGFATCGWIWGFCSSCCEREDLAKWESRNLMASKWVLEGMMEWDLVLKWNSQFEWRIGAPMLIVFSWCLSLSVFEILDENILYHFYLWIPGSIFFYFLFVFIFFLKKKPNK